MTLSGQRADTCTTPPKRKEKNMNNPVQTQLALHAVLDVIWPILPPHVLEALAYV